METQHFDKHGLPDKPEKENAHDYEAVVAKFEVQFITHHSGGAAHVNLAAVSQSDGDNRSWSRYTPSGTLEMHITNPNAAKFFKPGKKYFLQFTPATP